MSLRPLVHREVPQEWQRQLAEISPPTTRFTWLRLRWEPGRPWEAPVERYMIDQMMPARMMTSEYHAGILEQLQRGLPPQGYYDEVLGRYVEEEHCLITTRAWHLYRETKCWASAFWVIQGSTGGHKYDFTPGEKKCLRLLGLSDEAPSPGDLPYAPFDERVIAKLEEHDMLKGLDTGLATSKRLLHGAQSSRVEAQEKALRERLVAFLKSQIDDVAADYDTSLSALDMPRRIISREENLAMERASEIAEQNYIEHGRTNGGASLILLP